MFDLLMYRGRDVRKRFAVYMKKNHEATDISFLLYSELLQGGYKKSQFYISLSPSWL